LTAKLKKRSGNRGGNSTVFLCHRIDGGIDGGVDGEEYREMKRGRNIACLKRNGHWFYFRWDDENEAKMLFQAYLQSVDPMSRFDAVGLHRLVTELKNISPGETKETLYFNEPDE